MSLMTTYPSIAREWHPILNTFVPSDIAPPADKVFVAKKVTLHLLKNIVGYLQDFDSDKLFSARTSRYVETKKFQNSDLFKTTYDAIRKRR